MENQEAIAADLIERVRELLPLARTFESDEFTPLDRRRFQWLSQFEVLFLSDLMIGLSDEAVLERQKKGWVVLGGPLEVRWSWNGPKQPRSTPDKERVLRKAARLISQLNPIACAAVSEFSSGERDRVRAIAEQEIRELKELLIALSGEHLRDSRRDPEGALAKLRRALQGPD